MEIRDFETLDRAVAVLGNKLSILDDKVSLYTVDGQHVFRMNVWPKHQYSFYFVMRKDNGGLDIRTIEFWKFGVTVDLPIDSEELKREVHHAYVAFKESIASATSSSPADVPPTDPV